VAESVGSVFSTGNHELMLMQCTAAYPAPLESLNVLAIPRMKERFLLPVGLSDHSRDPLIGPVAAAALGANLLEKHFTLSNQLPGPDHAFAVEPDELIEMVQRVRETESGLGTGEKKVHPVEEELRRFARRHLVAVRDIAAGEAISRENALVLRRGKLPEGLEPKYYEEVLGRPARRAIPAGTAIRREDCD